ncbi:MAG TPA: hypothetical protein VK689_18055, partial [Armatimonadota bacterium]|nr:hypothetical protein [Armatimonadota bacterium]
MSATDERNRAMEAARRDYPTALKWARGVSDAWFRAQALAGVARYAPESDVVRIAEEALRAVADAKDAYRRVGSSAWAIRALVERGKHERAAKAALGLSEFAGNIDHPVSRLNALLVLWQAAFPLGGAVRRQILRRLIAACEAASSWQAGRALRDAALMVATYDP